MAAVWLVILTTAVLLILAALLQSGNPSRLSFSARTFDDRVGFKFPLASGEPSLFGRLQAMNVTPVQDGGLALQWHLLGWPNPWFDRFPHTIDQNIGSKRNGPTDDVAYWSGGYRKASIAGQTTMTCPQANPHTPSSYRIWDSAVSSPGYHLGELMLSDSQADLSHVDLNGTISLAQLNSFQELPVDAHGTHVAGVVGALRNGEGVVGVIPGLQTMLFPIPVLKTRAGPRIDGSKTLENLDAIIASLIARNAKNERIPRVILLSWAFFESDGLSQEFVEALSSKIRQLLDFDVALVVPSGNLETGRFESTGKIFPASWAGQFRDMRGSLLPVGALDVCSRAAWFSNLASNDLGTVLLAPGERIYSTLPNNDFGFMSGTSAAAAQVAAVLAMTSAQFPDVEMKTQVHTLLRTAFPINHFDGERMVSFDAPGFVQGLMAEFGWIARY